MAKKSLPAPPETAPATPPSETQRRILAAALELFAEKGYAATSTAAIAKRAGVAEKTIFANFETKDRLFGQILNPAALELLLPGALGGVRETLEAPWSSLPRFIDGFLRNRFDFVRSHPAKLKLIAQAVILHPELSGLILGVFRNVIEPRLAQVVKRLEEAGELRPLPRDSMVRIMVSVTVGYMLSRFVLRPGSRWDDEAELETMKDVLVNGLRARKEAVSEPSDSRG